jgi:hypothetical protein
MENFTAGGVNEVAIDVVAPDKKRWLFTKNRSNIDTKQLRHVVAGCGVPDAKTGIRSCGPARRLG